MPLGDPFYSGPRTITGRAYRGPQTHGINLTGQLPDLTPQGGLKGSYSANHPSSIAAAQSRISGQQARANAGPMVPPHPMSPIGQYQPDMFGGMSHAQATAGLGASGGGAPGSLLAGQQGANHVQGLMAHLNETMPEIAHQPSVPNSPHPTMASRYQSARQFTMAARGPQQQAQASPLMASAQAPKVAVPKPPAVAAVPKPPQPREPMPAHEPGDVRGIAMGTRPQRFQKQPGMLQRAGAGVAPAAQGMPDI